MTNKKILIIILIIMSFLFLIALGANNYMANAQNKNVYYFEELSIGDFVPNGSVLMVNTSFAFSGDSADSVKVIFKYSNRTEEKILAKDFQLTVPNAENCDGWFLEGMDYQGIVFSPETKENLEKKKIEEPCKENSYKIIGDNSIYNNYSFYKVNDVKIPEPSIDNKNQFIGWENKNDTYCYEWHEATNIILRKKDEPTMSFDFDVKNGQIISFDLKSMCKSEFLKAFVNGQEIIFSLEDNYTYNKWFIIIKDDGKIDISDSNGNIRFSDLNGNGNEGKLNLTFKIVPSTQAVGSYSGWYEGYDSGSYSGSYSKFELYGIRETYYYYLKNINVLTKINDGDTLDIEKVNNGDKIYWRATSVNSSNVDGNFIYEK